MQLKTGLFEGKDLKITLGIPNMGTMHTGFVMSLCNMLVSAHQYRFGKAKSQRIYTMQVMGSMLGKLRQEVVTSALENGSDYIFFLDTDHEFPRNILHRFLAWDVPVVAANCVTKTMPCQPTARTAPCEGYQWGKPVFSDPEKKGLEEVWRVGTGVMLLKTEVFRGIDPKHLFDSGWNDTADCYQGEDWTMITRVSEAGHKIYVDHDVSREVTHIGYFKYSHDYVGQVINEDGYEGREREIAEVAPGV